MDAFPCIQLVLKNVLGHPLQTGSIPLDQQSKGAGPEEKPFRTMSWFLLANFSSIVNKVPQKQQQHLSIA